MCVVCGVRSKNSIFFFWHGSLCLFYNGRFKLEDIRGMYRGCKHDIHSLQALWQTSMQGRRTSPVLQHAAAITVFTLLNTGRQQLYLNRAYYLVFTALSSPISDKCFIPIVFRVLSRPLKTVQFSPSCNCYLF